MPSEGVETDLEKFVNAPGRDEKIKQVRSMIDEMGIEYLYLQFVSVTGKIMGKGIPADHWESVATTCRLMLIPIGHFKNQAFLYVKKIRTKSQPILIQFYNFACIFHILVYLWFTCG